MNKEFWEKYAQEADSHYNEEFAKFIRDLTTSLRCTSVLEVGCNAGNDLKLFPDTIEIHGIDSNEKIIEIAKTRIPSAKFQVGKVTELPYEDSSIDLVFTHGFFNYLEDDQDYFVDHRRDRDRSRHQHELGGAPLALLPRVAAQAHRGRAQRLGRPGRSELSCAQLRAQSAGRKPTCRLRSLGS